MKIFVVNCGSSSIKYRLFDMSDETAVAGGVMERVGTDQASHRFWANGAAPSTVEVAAAGGGDYTVGLRTILATLVEQGAVQSVAEIDGVGHRVVHGGEAITASRVIEEDVLAAIRDNCELAPLHNPPNLAGINAATAAVPDVPHVAVFDTAFLATLPPRAHRYAVPERWYTEHHVRRYGFHGTSHRYVTLRAAELLNKGPGQVNLITAHLGNGCSITAVAGGKAVDHSMGMTPLEGLVMGTRSGDLDPAVIFYMAARGMNLRELERALNKQSGLLGVSGRSNDMRDLLSAMEDGDERSALAVELFVYRLVKYIGAYHAILPALDAVVLTGGIGENSAAVRRRLCRQLGRLGVDLDEGQNEQIVGGRTGAISSADSAMPVWVVPTNEELMIARDTKALVEGAG